VGHIGLRSRNVLVILSRVCILFIQWPKRIPHKLCRTSYCGVNKQWPAFSSGRFFAHHPLLSLKCKWQTLFYKYTFYNNYSACYIFCIKVKMAVLDKEKLTILKLWMTIQIIFSLQYFNFWENSVRWNYWTSNIRKTIACLKNNLKI